MKEDTQASAFALLASDGAFDPLEEGVRQRVRHFIETVLEEELRRRSAAADMSALARANEGPPSRPPHAAGDRHVRRRDGEGAAGAHDR